MLTQEQTVEIRVLARQGHSIRHIARTLGVSRNTVRRYLRDPSVARYQPREPRPTKLGPFESYLRQRVEQAHPIWLPATVLNREIRAQGYGGGLSLLRAFLATLKPARREAGPAVRFETEPGRQLQADFVVLRRARSPMSAFVATLGYSRMTFVTFVPDESFESVRDSLLLAFDYLGGVPREVLFDNMKTVVLERDAYGDGKHRFHPGLLQLADDLGFRIPVGGRSGNTCNPCHPVCGATRPPCWITVSARYHWNLSSTHCLSMTQLGRPADEPPA